MGTWKSTTWQRVKQRCAEIAEGRRRATFKVFASALLIGTLLVAAPRHNPANGVIMVPPVHAEKKAMRNIRDLENALKELTSAYVKVTHALNLAKQRADSSGGAISPAQVIQLLQTFEQKLAKANSLFPDGHKLEKTNGRFLIEQKLATVSSLARRFGELHPDFDSTQGFNANAYALLIDDVNKYHTSANAKLYGLIQFEKQWSGASAAKELPVASVILPDVPTRDSLAQYLEFFGHIPLQVYAKPFSKAKKAEAAGYLRELNSALTTAQKLHDEYPPSDKTKKGIEREIEKIERIKRIYNEWQQAIARYDNAEEVIDQLKAAEKTREAEKLRSAAEAYLNSPAKQRPRQEAKLSAAQRAAGLELAKVAEKEESASKAKEEKKPAPESYSAEVPDIHAKVTFLDGIIKRPLYYLDPVVAWAKKTKAQLENLHAKATKLSKIAKQDKKTKKQTQETIRKITAILDKLENAERHLSNAFKRVYEASNLAKQLRENGKTKQADALQHASRAFWASGVSRENAAEKAAKSEALRGAMAAAQTALAAKPAPVQPPVAEREKKPREIQPPAVTSPVWTPTAVKPAMHITEATEKSIASQALSRLEKAVQETILLLNVVNLESADALPKQQELLARQKELAKNIAEYKKGNLDWANLKRLEDRVYAEADTIGIILECHKIVKVGTVSDKTAANIALENAAEELQKGTIEGTFKARQHAFDAVAKVYDSAGLLQQAGEDAAAVRRIAAIRAWAIAAIDINSYKTPRIVAESVYNAQNATRLLTAAITVAENALRVSGLAQSDNAHAALGRWIARAKKLKDAKDISTKKEEALQISDALHYASRGLLAIAEAEYMRKTPAITRFSDAQTSQVATAAFKSAESAITLARTLFELNYGDSYARQTSGQYPLDVIAAANQAWAFVAPLTFIASEPCFRDSTLRKVDLNNMDAAIAEERKHIALITLLPEFKNGLLGQPTRERMLDSKLKAGYEIVDLYYGCKGVDYPAISAYQHLSWRLYEAHVSSHGSDESWLVLPERYAGGALVAEAARQENMQAVQWLPLLETSLLETARYTAQMVVRRLNDSGLTTDAILKYANNQLLAIHEARRKQAEQLFSRVQQRSSGGSFVDQHDARLYNRALRLINLAKENEATYRRNIGGSLLRGAGVYPSPNLSIRLLEAAIMDLNSIQEKPVKKSTIKVARAKLEYKPELPATAPRGTVPETKITIRLAEEQPKGISSLLTPDFRVGAMFYELGNNDVRTCNDFYVLMPSTYKPKKEEGEVRTTAHFASDRRIYVYRDKSTKTLVDARTAIEEGGEYEKVQVGTYTVNRSISGISLSFVPNRIRNDFADALFVRIDGLYISQQDKSTAEVTVSAHAQGTKLDNNVGVVVWQQK